MKENYLMLTLLVICYISL